jgi:hypothetical protein
MQDQHRHQQDWQGAAFQLLQEQRISGQTQHHVAQQWSRVALDGIQQAQQGVQHLYDLTATVQSHVVSMLQTTHGQQSVMVEEAVRQVAMKKWRHKLLFVSLLLLAIPVLLGVCYFILTHLY